MADQANLVTTDSDGNIYVAGRSSGSSDFDCSAPTANMTASPRGDYFLSQNTATGATCEHFTVTSAVGITSMIFHSIHPATSFLSARIAER